MFFFFMSDLILASASQRTFTEVKQKKILYFPRVAIKDLELCLSGSTCSGLIHVTLNQSLH